MNARAVERHVSSPLRVPTDAKWFDVACERWQELLLDHANCEKKAASTALSLIFAYAEDLDLTNRLSRLAREELRHFEQVQKHMADAGVAFRRLTARALRRRTATCRSPQRAGAPTGFAPMRCFDRSALVRALRRARAEAA